MRNRWKLKFREKWTALLPDCIMVLTSPSAVFCSLLTCPYWWPTLVSDSPCLKLLFFLKTCSRHSPIPVTITLSIMEVQAQQSLATLPPPSTYSTFFHPWLHPSVPPVAAPTRALDHSVPLAFPFLTIFLLEPILQFTTSLSFLRWGFAFVTPKCKSFSSSFSEVNSKLPGFQSPEQSGCS